MDHPVFTSREFRFSSKRYIKNRDVIFGLSNENMHRHYTYIVYDSRLGSNLSDVVWKKEFFNSDYTEKEEALLILEKPVI